MTDGRRVAEAAVLSVSQATALVQAHLEMIERVAVEGELSGKLAASGHYYGCLRDGANTLEIIVWKSDVTAGGPLPADGTQVVAYGRIGAWAGSGRSQYRLVVKRLEVAGLGALLARLEVLKQKLLAEGLFDPARKKHLPRLPRRIGIITSPKGAVIRDMLHRIGARCPRPVVVWPVAVQGAGAAEEIARAVAGFNAWPAATRPDVLIVARGGGSLEDLMCFNDERVARAVAGSAIPVVSGVGHEPDVTLCDLAADLRAPTPTAAAEFVVPVRDDLLAELRGAAAWLTRETRGRLERGWEKVDHLRRLLPPPQRQLQQARQRLADWGLRLRPLGPLALRQAGQRLDGLGRVLLGQNPRAPLEKGYAYVTDAAGRMIRRAAEVAGEMELHFADGARGVVARE
jgi:exodeoxyribonuclease VII large subunit